ncbi:NUDIX domain-containing protein [Reinekea marina]|uniref:NUDIX domain-containing protein n=1 Tax=Reinekea marina TaxID=1310421 RepID=A0ABV7WRD9_9GAMM|nr:NUDIX domain-containing protein [Reinekea marina]MDN3649545.1 NUDIX domain-containing protein [Reinekea marina]
MTINKACPIVVRKRDGALELLAFEHPLAGYQLVKGTIEKYEPLETACIRELFEESGLNGVVESYLGKWDSNFEGQIWGFCLIKLLKEPSDSWVHYCLDDNGHNFRFFWLPLNSDLDDNWHPLFKGAIRFIRNHL